MLLPHYNHRLGCLVHILWLGADRHEFNIVFDPEDLAPSLRLDIFLSNVLGLIVEQTMRVARPGYAAHVHFVLLLEGANVLKLALTLSLVHGLSGWRVSMKDVLEA